MCAMRVAKDKKTDKLTSTLKQNEPYACPVCLRYAYNMP